MISIEKKTNGFNLEDVFYEKKYIARSVGVEGMVEVVNSNTGRKLLNATKISDLTIEGVTPSTIEDAVNKINNIVSSSNQVITGSEIKTLYEDEPDTNAFTDNFKQEIEKNKVTNVTTDSVSDKLVITYTDGTQKELNLSDVTNDIRVTDATLDATTNNLILTSNDGQEINIDLSRYVSHTEIVDNANSSSKDTPLSANQGRVLLNQIRQKYERYLLNGKFKGTTTIISSGEVFEYEFENETVFRFISSDEDSFGYPVEDSFYGNFSNGSLTDLIVSKGN